GDGLLQLSPVCVAAGEGLAHERVEVRLRVDRHPRASGDGRQRETAPTDCPHGSSDDCQGIWVRSNRNASSMSARDFSSDAITARMSLTDSIPRYRPLASTTSRW